VPHAPRPPGPQFARAPLRAPPAALPLPSGPPRARSGRTRAPRARAPRRAAPRRRRRRRTARRLPAPAAASFPPSPAAARAHGARARATAAAAAMPSKPLKAIKPMFQKGKWRILRGDLVQITAGKDKGLSGRVLSVIRDNRFPRVVVEGRNMVRGGAGGRGGAGCQGWGGCAGAAAAGDGGRPLSPGGAAAAGLYIHTAPTRPPRSRST
jgi:hypothetical protein